MASSTAVIIGLRHHESLRSVRSVICALVLAGASDSCVILQRPRCLVRDRDAARGQAAVMGAGAVRACDVHELIPVSHSMPHQSTHPACETGYIAGEWPGRPSRVSRFTFQTMTV